MQNLGEMVSQLNSSPGSEIIFAATDIPFYHFLAFKELTFFKLYAWQQSAYIAGTSYTDFYNHLVSDELLDCYEKTVRNYRRIPSSEIWTQNTLDYSLNLLEYFYDTGHFSDKKMAVSLCEQFIELIDTIQRWTINGIKDEETHTPFKLYLSDTLFESSFIMFKQIKDDRLTMQCSLKLFTINSLNITDQIFCRETDQWLDHLTKQSLLISGASEKERYTFFSKQKQKIQLLIDKICRDIV
jgi:hypothetical protein